MVADRALYYPYIHIRKVDWLKATLLQFKQVQRMTPAPGAQPNDDPELEAYTRSSGSEEPLLESAKLWNPRAMTAQDHLAGRLTADAQDPQFKARFGAAAALRLIQPDNRFGFQIHQQKLSPNLQKALRDTGLAWEPNTREPYDLLAQKYVQLHPLLGEVVMSTLGIACASGDGLDMVAQERSATLHRFLMEGDADALYDRFLKQAAGATQKPAAPTAGQLLEVVVNFSCNFDRLTPESLRALGEDRQPIRTLMANLEKRVLEIPAMDPGRELDTRLREAANAVLQEWQRDLNNVPNFVRRFFGVDGVDPAAKATEKAMAVSTELSKQAVVAMTAGPAAGGGAYAIAGMDPIVVGGVGIGLVLISHVGKTIHEGAKQEADSPYLFLTQLHKAGVLVRRAPHAISKGI